MPTVQNNSSVEVRYGLETTMGVASGAAGKVVRRNTSSLGPSKDTFGSDEVRPDMQINDLRHGLQKVTGGAEVEISTVSHDDLYEALLRGTWATGVTAAPATTTSIAANSGASTFTWTAGDPLAVGFKVGDVIRLTGTSLLGNDLVNYRITAINGTGNRTITVFPAPVTMAANTGATMVVQGKKLLMGVVKRSFTFEHYHADLDISEQFLGCRVGGGNFRCPPTGMAKCTFDVLGLQTKMLPSANAPFFAAPTAAGTTGIVSNLSGAVRVNGVELGTVTDLNFQVQLGLSSQAVVGTNVAPDVFYGKSLVTGSVSVFLTDESLINVLLNELEVDIVSVMEAAMVAPKDFLAISLQRMKFTSAGKTIQGEGGVIVEYGFQGLLKAGGAGTAYDQSSMVMQRSN